MDNWLLLVNVITHEGRYDMEGEEYVYELGAKIEKWTLVEPKMVGRHKAWKCRSVCGSETTMPNFKIGKISKSCKSCVLRKHGSGIRKLEPGQVYLFWTVISVAEDAPSADLRRLWVQCSGCSMKYNHVERRILNKTASCIECTKLKKSGRTVPHST